MSTCQSALSSVSALLYLIARRKRSHSFLQLVGLAPSDPPKPTTNGSAVNGHTSEHKGTKAQSHPGDISHWNILLLRYFQCSLFITFAAPFGFAALSHISYPAMVLGKSCKLVPVMFMNVILYRRSFAPHKYIVVALVTTGITSFMFFGSGSSKSKRGSNESSGPTDGLHSVIGIIYLLINLALDGATNSTQDEIFARYRVSGQQMMLWINLFCTIVTSFMSVLPLPYIPVLHPTDSGQTELAGAIDFIRNHPAIVVSLAQFALTGALGQLFIFETLQHFGSLTLVYVTIPHFLRLRLTADIAYSCRTVTLTRKLFTMLLSVVVYNHKLAPGQWLGAAIVFAGISVEAWVKRRGASSSQRLPNMS